jgi:hypothetical protein
VEGEGRVLSAVAGDLANLAIGTGLSPAEMPGGTMKTEKSVKTISARRVTVTPAGLPGGQKRHTAGPTGRGISFMTEAISLQPGKMPVQAGFSTSLSNKQDGLLHFTTVHLSDLFLPEH